MKIAVILFNLGGPDSSEAVRPFLFNLFKDKNIIRLPAIIRYPLGYLISSLRHKKAAKIYDKLGGKSPINVETQAQAKALEISLNEKQEDQTFKVFYAQQYWHPMHKEVVDKVGDYAPDKIVLLPLYPQFSTTTTKSSFEVWQKETKNILDHIPHYKICCYPQNKGFIQAYGDLLIEKLEKSPHKNQITILYSAHGIPQDCVDDGDPYELQIHLTAQAITDYLKSKNYHNAHKITYQSKVGPKNGWNQIQKV